LVANNADRKSGHCLLGPDGRIWAIDNGLCFNVDPKLRTVIWEFAGEPLPDDVRDDLRRFVKHGVPSALTELVDERERATLLGRSERLGGSGALRGPRCPSGILCPTGGPTMAAETFDRKAEDVGNIVFLEHVNFRVPDQQLATAFYVTALGFTRDPYLMVGLDNMWINLGRSQFHLPTGNPNHSRGRVGCVVSDFDALPERLTAAEKWLTGTRYTHKAEKNHADVTCPWGNRLRLHRAGSDFGFMTLGMPY